jgi:hypothetical protein
VGFLAEHGTRTDEIARSPQIGQLLLLAAHQPHGPFVDHVKVAPVRGALLEKNFPLLRELHPSRARQFEQGLIGKVAERREALEEVRNPENDGGRFQSVGEAGDLHVEPELDDVAVLDGVFFAFDA